MQWLYGLLSNNYGVIDQFWLIALPIALPIAAFAAGTVVFALISQDDPFDSFDCMFPATIFFMVPVLALMFSQDYLQLAVKYATPTERQQLARCIEDYQRHDPAVTVNGKNIDKVIFFCQSQYDRLSEAEKSRLLIEQLKKDSGEK